MELPSAKDLTLGIIKLKWLRFDRKENKIFCEFCREFHTNSIHPKKSLKMIRVISSFADGSVNFNLTGPAEDQTLKIISSTDKVSS